MNTLRDIQAADALAVHSWFDDHGWSLANPCFEKITVLYSRTGSTAKAIKVTFSRREMDENGGGAGYTYWDIYWTLFKKDKLGIYGFPTELSAYALIPRNYKIRNMRFEKPRTPAFDDDSFFPSDEDFLASETDYVISTMMEQLPEAVFDHDSRTWRIGAYEYCIDTPDLRETPLGKPFK